MKLALVTSWPTDISSQFSALGCHLHSLIQVSGMCLQGHFRAAGVEEKTFPTSPVTGGLKSCSISPPSQLFTRRNDVEAEAPILWPPDEKN